MVTGRFRIAGLLTHPAPALALAVGLGTRIIPPRLAVAALLFAMLPDLDVVGFKFGIKYADALGHRGLSHSLAMALGAGTLGFLLAPWLKSGRLKAFVVLCGAVLIHILLDALTAGGLGVAFFRPWKENRYFLPWRPIAVSPFGIKAFFSDSGLSDRGMRVIQSELLWVWLPCALFALAGITTRRVSRRRSSSRPHSRPLGQRNGGAGQRDGIFRL